MKLEPFDEGRVRCWLDVWNSSNAAYIDARGTRPLSAETVLRNPDLCGQPLLLMMLALYDIDDNTLQKNNESMDEAELYERLIVDFVEREVHKSRPELVGDALRAAVETELLRLSVAAFAMFNRGRQWVTEAELIADLAALPNVVAPAVPAAGFREPLTPAQAVVSRFFFIHEAQAVRDDRRLTTVEFLHATFSEYLISRLIIRELIDLSAVTAVVTSRNRMPSGDGFLRALLSFAPLTMRSQVVDFLTEQAKRMPADDASRIKPLLLDAFQGALEPPQSRTYEDYRPASLNVPALHAAYSANLVLLILVIGDRVTGRELFPHAPFSVKEWRQHAMLWRSQFSGEGWRSLAAMLELERVWFEGERDISITLRVYDWPKAADLNGFWIFKYPPGKEHRREWTGWRTVRIRDLRHESFVTCDLAEDVAWHALEPITNELDARVLDEAPTEVEATAAFGMVDQDNALSVTNALLRLWLESSNHSSSPSELERAYEDCLNVIERSRPDEDIHSRDAYYVRVLRQLAADRDRLSPEFLKRIYSSYTNALIEESFRHEQVMAWFEQAFAHLE